MGSSSIGELQGDSVAGNGGITLDWVYTLQTGSNNLISLVTDETLSGVNSTTNPALAAFNGHLYLAWKGIDSGGHLHIVEVY